MSHKYYIYTDGACSGNPGPGGWGSIIYDHKKNLVSEYSGRAQSTTNNKMELTAVIQALAYIDGKGNDLEILVFTDSTYVIRGITQWIFGWKKRGWKNFEGKDVANVDLWHDLDEQVRRLSTKIKWYYVRGHKGHHGNERCDEMAVRESQNEYVTHFNGQCENYFFNISEMPEFEPLPDMSSMNKEKKAGYYISLIDGVLYKDNDWGSCERKVKGRSGVKFKKVKNSSEEQEILKSWGVDSSRAIFVENEE